MRVAGHLDRVVTRVPHDPRVDELVVAEEGGRDRRYGKRLDGRLGRGDRHAVSIFERSFGVRHRLGQQEVLRVRLIPFLRDDELAKVRPSQRHLVQPPNDFSLNDVRKLTLAHLLVIMRALDGRVEEEALERRMLQVDAGRLGADVDSSGVYGSADAQRTIW